MNKADLTYLDVGLDPQQDPRIKQWPHLQPETLMYEEMLTLGLHPDQISEEAYLKARRQYVAGKIASLDAMVKRAKRYQREFNRRDRIIGELVDEIDAQWETTEDPKE